MSNPYSQMQSKWTINEDYPGGIQIQTEDGSLRIFRMFHSGFGPSTNDRAIAQHVVDPHNASLKEEKLSMPTETIRIDGKTAKEGDICQYKEDGEIYRVRVTERKETAANGALWLRLRLMVIKVISGDRAMLGEVFNVTHNMAYEFQPCGWRIFPDGEYENV